MIDMIIAGYFEDDDAAELTNDPVFKSVLQKNLQYPDATGCYSGFGLHLS